MKKKNSDFQSLFHNLKFVCAGLSGLLILYFILTIFTETFGGPFPQRVRGPLAHEPFYQLGELPTWEDVIHEQVRSSDGDLVNHLELLLEGEEIPPLEFGTPTPTQNSISATPTPSMINEN